MDKERRDGIVEGARLLDKISPKWYKVLAEVINELRVSDGSRCVLHHLFGGYTVGSDIVYGRLSVRERDKVWDGGFCCAPEENDDLRKAWREEVEMRLGQPVEVST